MRHHTRYSTDTPGGQGVLEKLGRGGQCGVVPIYRISRFIYFYRPLCSHKYKNV